LPDRGKAVANTLFVREPRTENGGVDLVLPLQNDGGGLGGDLAVVLGEGEKEGLRHVGGDGLADTWDAGDGDESGACSEGRAGDHHGGARHFPAARDDQERAAAAFVAGGGTNRDGGAEEVGAEEEGLGG